MDEHHCLPLAEESYLTAFPVKFLDIITILFAVINMFWARLRLILAAARAKIRDYFDIAMTKFVINNRTDALKIDVNSFFTITNCRIAGSRSLISPSPHSLRGSAAKTLFRVRLQSRQLRRVKNFKIFLSIQVRTCVYAYRTLRACLSHKQVRHLLSRSAFDV